MRPPAVRLHGLRDGQREVLKAPVSPYILAMRTFASPTAAMSVAALLCVGLVSGAWAGSPATLSTPVGPLAAPKHLPNDIRWFRSSAEYRALTRQTYSVATARLPVLARALPSQSWA